MAKFFDTLISEYIQAQNTGDFPLFKSLFSKTVHHEVEEDAFFDSQLGIQAENGNITKAIYLANLTRNKRTWLLFKVRFDESIDEFLLTIIITDTTVEPKALGIWLS